MPGRPSGFSNHLDSIVDAPGPKKLLSIDGGGIRGLIAIEFLARIESLLRERLRDDELRLCDYFDYVAGTSTGAIIATLIALGYSVDEIRRFYEQGAELMFAPSNVFQKLARKANGPFALLIGMIGTVASSSMFTPRELTKAIVDVCGAGTTLGSDRLQTLLMIVMRNVSTDSPWWISNNPHAKFNVDQPGVDGRDTSNLKIPLWKLVRASTAAPIFFPAEEIHVPGLPKPFIFQDGGMTVHNNPAFQLFLMATLPAYNLRWRVGEDDMLLVSVGTGLCESAEPDRKLKQMSLLYNARSLPAALIRGATYEQDLLCRVFGRLGHTRDVPIWDSEVGSLSGNAYPASTKYFTYLRYNVELSDAGIAALSLPERIDAKAIQALDGVKHVSQLSKIGNAAATNEVCEADFDRFFSLRTGGEHAMSGAT